jgi:hypothetical protein
MARRIRIRLVRDDLGALDLLSIGGFHVSPHGPVNPRAPRWRRWRRRAKPAGRKPLVALLPILARKLRQRGRRHDQSGLNRPH